MCDGTAGDVVATASAVVVGAGVGQERVCVRKRAKPSLACVIHALPGELRDGCLPHTWTRSSTDEELSSATLSREERRSG